MVVGEMAVKIHSGARKLKETVE